MLEPGGPKKPPISENHIQMQLSDEESSSNTPFLFSTPCPIRKDKDKDIEMEENNKQLPIKKRRCLQSSLEKKKQGPKKGKTQAYYSQYAFFYVFKTKPTAGPRKPKPGIYRAKKGETKE